MASVIDGNDAAEYAFMVNISIYNMINVSKSANVNHIKRTLQLCIERHRRENMNGSRPRK